MKDEEKINSRAWDEEVKRNNYWTRQVSRTLISQARNGEIHTTLTPEKEIPQSWFANLGKKVLALASGGGQQAILLSAAGYDVTLVDISNSQLNQDRELAKKENLTLKTIQASMNDLSFLEAESFDSVINPCSLNFVSDCTQVFKEVARVLKKNGHFLFALANPALYLFDVDRLEKGKLKLKYTLPFDGTKSLSEKQRKKLIENCGTLEFSHTLSTIIGGLCQSGFVIKDFYSSPAGFEPIDSYLCDCYLAFLAVKTDDVS